MFTKEDYAAYFGQIARVERKMAYGAYDLAHQLGDSKIARILEKIGDDEVRHYDYVLKAFALIPGGKARNPQEYCVGTALLRRAQDPASEGIEAYCVHLSKTGMCLECDQELSIGEEQKIEVRLYSKSELMVFQGKVSWSKRTETGFFILGISFTG